MVAAARPRTLSHAGRSRRMASKTFCCEMSANSAAVIRFGFRRVRADPSDVVPVLEQAAEASVRASAMKTAECFVMVGRIGGLSETRQ